MKHQRALLLSPNPGDEYISLSVAEGFGEGVFLLTNAV